MMAKRKFDESKVKRDESGRFVAQAGIGKQHDLKSVMNNRLGSGNSKNVRMSSKSPRSTGPGKKRSNTHPKQGGNLGHVKTHKARKWGLR